MVTCFGVDEGLAVEFAGLVVAAAPVVEALEEVDATTTTGAEVECEETTAMLEDDATEALEEVAAPTMELELVWMVCWKTLALAN